MTLKDWLVIYSRDRDVGAAYVYQLGYAIDRLTAFLGRDATFGDLTRETVNSWLQEEQLTGELAPRSRRNLRTSICTLWRGAAEDGHAPPPQRIRPVKVPESIPDAWRFDELTRVAAAAGRLPGVLSNGVPRKLYFPTLIWFDFETGLRRRDVLSFDLRQLKAGCGGFTQHKSGRTHVYSLTSETMADLVAISEMLRSQGDPHWRQPLRFPNALTMLYYWFRRIRELAGIDADVGNRSLQHLRRTGATQVEIESPGSAPDYLGHGSGPELARKHYIDRRVVGRTVTPGRNRTCAPQAKRSSA